MHTKPMSESDGTFTRRGEAVERRCYKVVDGGRCNAAMTCETWESSCGGYEDYKYTCSNGHVEWVNGIDS